MPLPQPKPDRISILHLEDDPLDAEFFAATLRGVGMECEITLARNKEAYQAALIGPDSRFDLILSDNTLPGFSGAGALSMAKAERPDLVLCDIDMPGMGGGDVVAALSSDPQTAGIPVMYLTALVSPEETRDMGGNVGGRPGVAKRAPIAELLQRIGEIIPA